ncbi:MAG: hypothetical protein L0Y35_04030 [Flammeovirgaceae bacterium]|nr:hypothetical protein [Flammeovirgaceae bacterium]
MKNVCVMALFAIITINAYAQKKKKQDAEAIKSMCGCYEVAFDFAETFAPDKEYKFHDNYHTAGLELVLPIEDSDNKIVLQHLLIINDSTIIKHWRQDWEYENTAFYIFDKENTWKYVKKPAEVVKGQWTQKVFQVDDGPRYEGSASWVHIDGKHFWESTTNSPLPRREFTKRSDYNVMVRGNRHEITSYGWLHEQDNKKVLRGEKTDKLIAEEKGINTYAKTDASKCQAAEKWWSDHKIFWTDVRQVWDELFQAKKTISIKGRVDDKVLFTKLFELEKEKLSLKPYNSESVRQSIQSVIQSYLNGDYKFALR